jgi:hypothetical protein
MRKSSLLALLVAAVALGACDSKPKCLVDAKDTATVLEVENVCSAYYGRRGNSCSEYDRLRMQRDSDGTVCVLWNTNWQYKAGDKIRGPL